MKQVQIVKELNQVINEVREWKKLAPDKSHLFHGPSLSNEIDLTIKVKRTQPPEPFKWWGQVVEQAELSCDSTPVLIYQNSDGYLRVQIDGLLVYTPFGYGLEDETMGAIVEISFSQFKSWLKRYYSEWLKIDD